MIGFTKFDNAGRIFFFLTNEMVIFILNNKMDPFKMKILIQYGMHPIHYQMNLGCFNELVLIVNYAEN